jgi:hypothetical protein
VTTFFSPSTTPRDLAAAVTSVPSLRAGHACPFRPGVSARALVQASPGGYRQVALMVLAAIYGIHLFSRPRPDYRALRTTLSVHPAGCRVLSRAMAGETINEPNGPGRE